MLLGCLQLFLCRMWWEWVGGCLPSSVSTQRDAAVLFWLVRWYVMCRPRKVSILTVSTEDPLMYYGRWSLQCQFVLSTFRDKLLFAQQSTRCSILTHRCRWWGPLLQCHPWTWWCGLYCVWQYSRESLVSTTAPWGSSAQHDGARPVIASYISRLSEVSQ